MQPIISNDMDNNYMRLLRLVEDMRRLQKRFFAMDHYSPERYEVMTAAKERERQVDEIIRKELSPELFTEDAV